MNITYIPEVLHGIVLHPSWTESGMLKKFWNIEDNRVDKNRESHMPGFILLPDGGNKKILLNISSLLVLVIYLFSLEFKKKTFWTCKP